jgi:hypothetical protein
MTITLDDELSLWLEQEAKRCAVGMRRSTLTRCGPNGMTGSGNGTVNAVISC